MSMKLNCRDQKEGKIIILFLGEFIFWKANSPTHTEDHSGNPGTSGEGQKRVGLHRNNKDG